MAEELVKGIKSTSKSGSPHNDSNAALVKRWFGGMAAAALILRSGQYSGIPNEPRSLGARSLRRFSLLIGSPTVE